MKKTEFYQLPKTAKVLHTLLHLRFALNRLKIEVRALQTSKRFYMSSFTTTKAGL